MKENELKQQHIDYLKILFENGDWVAIHDVTNRSTPAVSLEKAAKTMSYFIAVNPIKKGTSRAQANVVRNSAWLLEADQEYIDFNTTLLDENSEKVIVPIEKQKRIIEESGIPYASVVYSGGKSMHIIPRVRQNLSKETWSAVWNAFSHVLWKYGLRIDPQTCDRARWTRRPGVLRDETNKYQTLWKVGKVIEFEELEAWFNANGVNWKDYLETNKIDRYIDWSTDSLPDLEAAHKAVCKYMFKGRSFGSESRAMDAFHYFMKMRGAGISKDDALRKALSEWGSVPSKDYESTEALIVKECNNVWNKTSVPAFAVTNLQHRDVIVNGVKESTPDLNIDDVVDSIDSVEESEPVKPDKPRKEAFFRNINNYILMNNDIMRLDYANPNRLNPKKVIDSVFKKKFRFTDQDYERLEEYDGFVNEPLILNYERKVFSSKWNVFNPVKHDVKKGPWPTIEKIITHIWGETSTDHDQREEIYDRHTVLLKHPKIKQQAVVLFSKAQKTGKSAWALLESLLVGEDNFARIKNDELESTFNSLWVNTLIMNLDEPYFKDRKKMTKVIREMITAPRQNLRKMQTDYEQVDFHAKLIVTTNDTDFMTFEKNDRRYWARRVDKFSDQDQDNKFEDKMKAEIGHYIYFLLYERKMKYPKRMDQTFWLPQSVVKTNSFDILCSDSEDDLVTAIKDIFISIFYKDKQQEHVVFRQKDLIDELRKVQKDYPGLNVNSLTTASLGQCLREDINADNNGGKPSRVKKGEKHWDLGVSEDRPEKLWRVYRHQFNLDGALFDAQSYIN